MVADEGEGIDWLYELLTQGGSIDTQIAKSVSKFSLLIDRNDKASNLPSRGSHIGNSLLAVGICVTFMDHALLFRQLLSHVDHHILRGIHAAHRQSLLRGGQDRLFLRGSRRAVLFVTC